MNIKQNYKKIIGISLIINIVIILLSVTFVLSQVTSTFTISSGVYPSAPTYTIWVEDSTYYAKNAYGSIDYSGTNFTVVWIGARDAIPTSGGEIFIKAGDYQIGQMMYIARPNLKIRGEGYGTRIYPTTTFLTDNMADNNTNAFIWINGNDDYPAPYVGGQAENIEISHIRFDGNHDIREGINAGGNVSNLNLHHLFIEEIETHALVGTQLWESKITDNLITRSGYAMQINNAHNLLISRNTIRGGHYQTFAYKGKGNGIYWNSGHNYTVTDNVIIGNNWNPVTGFYDEQNATSNSLGNGIVGFGADGMLIANNHISRVYDVGIWVYWQSGNQNPWYNQGYEKMKHRNVVIDSNVIVGFGFGGSGRGINIGGLSPLSGHNGTIISNNLVSQGNVGATTVGITLVLSSYSIITGNHVSNTTTNGITLLNSNYSIVANNIVNNWDYDDTSTTLSGGIYLGESSWCVVDGNIVSDYQASPTGDYGIYLYDEVHYTIVSSNIANPYQTAGIKEGTSITNTKYIGNWNGTTWLSGDG